MRSVVLAALASSALLRPTWSDAATVRPKWSDVATVRSPTPTCTSAEQHQFDFWIGDWVVTDSAGAKVLGTEHNVPVLGGCALQENWHGSDGSEGTSLNAFLVGPKKWHQSWIASNGNLLLLDGAFADGKMVLQGASAGPKGTILNRITWTPLADGRVRQTWDISVDGGKTWTLSFDGFYKRA